MQTFNQVSNVLKTGLITSLLIASTSAFSESNSSISNASLVAQLNAVQVTASQNTSKKVAQDNPYAMVKEAGTNTFNRMKAEKDNIQQDPEILRQIMHEELMPYIDYRFSAYKVLGSYANKLKKKELLEFVSVFKEYLVTSYAVAMGYYDDQVVKFDPERDFSKREDVTVRAVIIDENRPDIKVAFKVRKNRRSGKWQAYDMIAEGISMISSKQSEFESILRKDGVQKVIESMRKSIREPIKLQKREDSTASVEKTESSEAI